MVEVREVARSWPPGLESEMKGLPELRERPAIQHREGPGEDAPTLKLV